jgi:hypothetical protein
MRSSGAIMPARPALPALADRAGGSSFLSVNAAPPELCRPAPGARSVPGDWGWARLRVALRAALIGLPLIFVLGGGCTLSFSDHDDDDDDDDDDVIIIVDNDTSGAFPLTDAGLDPTLFRFDETLELEALSPAHLWEPERIGERELVAYAATVLLVNEERLALDLPASDLQYLDTRVEGGRATVLFGRPGAAGSTRANGAAAARDSEGAPEVGATYDASGRLVAIERLR